MLAFFLGGADLEMVEIRKLLRDRQPTDPPYDWHAKRMSWGAAISAYGQLAATALARGDTPVLVELRNDMGLPPARIIEIDHHGARAGADKPSSIEQVFRLLGRPRGQWTRRLALVAANDKSYIPGLVAAGARREEIAAIRADDRRAQGITEDESRAAAAAVEQRERLAGGTLTVVELSHDRFATVSDRLHRELGGPGYESLLILGRSEAQYDGAGRMIARLSAAVPDSWYGGSLPAHGFWGCRYGALGVPDAAAARPRLLSILLGR